MASFHSRFSSPIQNADSCRARVYTSKIMSLLLFLVLEPLPLPFGVYFDATNLFQIITLILLKPCKIIPSGDMRTMPFSEQKHHDHDVRPYLGSYQLIIICRGLHALTFYQVAIYHASYAHCSGSSPPCHSQVVLFKTHH